MTEVQDSTPTSRKRQLGQLAVARVIETDTGVGYAVPDNQPEFATTKDAEDFIRAGDYDGETLAVIRVVKTLRVAQQVRRVTSFEEV